MNQQTDLLNWLATRAPAARMSDPDTSHEAADAHPVVRGRDRVAALKAHAEHPNGLTDFELAELVGRQQTSAGKRRGELRDLGLIEQTEERRPAPSGSSAIVWRVTEEGKRMANQYVKSRRAGLQGVGA